MRRFFCASEVRHTDTDVTTKAVVNQANSARGVYKDFNEHMKKILNVEQLSFAELEIFIQKEKLIAETIFSEKCGNFRPDLKEQIRANYAKRWIALKDKINKSADQCKLQFIVQENLLRAVEEGVLHHRKKMTELVEKKQPLKDSQVKQFHYDYLNAIKEALISTFHFENIQIPTEILKSALQKLERDINSELDLHLMRHGVSMGNILQEIQSCTLEAEAVYETEMDKFIDTYGTNDGLSYTEGSFKSHHKKAKEKAESVWRKSMESRGLDPYLNASANLLAKLEQTFANLIEGFDMSSVET